MITVHHLNASRSQRVPWLLEELGVPYEFKLYQRDAKTKLAPPELKRVHPLGKSPVITDGDRVIAESGAIIEYIVDQYGNGKLKPAADSPERLRYTYWMHYAEGSAMPLLVMRLIFGFIEKQPVPFFIKPVVKGIVGKVNKSFLDPQFKLHFDFIEAELGKSEWFAGKEFTAADVQMSFPMEAAAARANLGSQYPKIKAFVDRIHARPAYQRAAAKVGPLEILG
jgi:glutathione S-transferase